MALFPRQNEGCLTVWSIWGFFLFVCFKLRLLVNFRHAISQCSVSQVDAVRCQTVLLLRTISLAGFLIIKVSWVPWVMHCVGLAQVYRVFSVNICQRSVSPVAHYCSYDTSKHNQSTFAYDVTAFYCLWFLQRTKKKKCPTVASLSHLCAVSVWRPLLSELNNLHNWDRSFVFLFIVFFCPVSIDFGWMDEYLFSLSQEGHCLYLPWIIASFPSASGMYCTSLRRLSHQHQCWSRAKHLLPHNLSSISWGAEVQYWWMLIKIKNVDAGLLWLLRLGSLQWRIVGCESCNRNFKGQGAKHCVIYSTLETMIKRDSDLERTISSAS